MLRTQAKPHVHTHPRYYLALGLMSAFVLLLTSILITSTMQVGTNQDLRRAASTATGEVEVIIGGSDAQTGQLVQIPFTTKGFTGVSGYEFTFTITGPAGMVESVTVEPASGLNVVTHLNSITDIAGGKKVRYIATTTNTDTGLSLADGSPLLVVKLTPAVAGSLVIETDNARSHVAILSKAGEDVLKTIPSRTLTISIPSSEPPDSPPPGDTTQPPGDTNSGGDTQTETAKDDLFIKDYSYKLYDGSTEITASQLQDGKSYRVKVTATAQNSQAFKDSNSTNNTNITMRLQVVDSAFATYNFAYSELQRQPGGLIRTLETPFVAKPEIKIQTIIDSANTIQEANENNNMVETAISNQTNTSSIGGVKGFANYCNAYCADSSECGFGLSCWYNKCRHPDNVESASCLGQNSTVSGCNIACSTSADCAAGLSCSNKLCRNPSNVGSATCAPKSVAVGAGTTAKPAPKATATPVTTTKTTPVATESATASATPVAVIKPTPSPTVAPKTMGDELLVLLAQIGIIDPNDPDSANQLGRLLIAGGVLLLTVFALIAFVRSRKSTVTTTAPPATKPTTTFTPFPPPKNSTIPVTTAQPQSTFKPTTPTASNQPPSVPYGTNQTTTPRHGVYPSVSPIPKAPTATQTSQAQTNTPTSSSMMQRLQEKGIGVQTEPTKQKQG